MRIFIFTAPVRTGCLSITDHDTLEGAAVKRAAAAKYGLRYVSGWEISAYAGRDKIHILGFGCDENGEAYAAFLQTRKAASLARAKDSAQKLRALGIPVTLQDVEEFHRDPSSPIHTMHIARAAAKKLGISEREAYLRYLSVGMPANSNIGRPTPREAIDCIHALGGIAVVAHPGRLEMPENEREKTILSLIGYGVDGIEAYYTTHTERETEKFLALARAHGLFVTGGSDTHVEDGTHAIGTPRFSPSSALLERVRFT